MEKSCQCFWIGRINSMTMAILLECDLQKQKYSQKVKKILNLVWKQKRPRIVKNIQINEKKSVLEVASCQILSYTIELQ